MDVESKVGLTETLSNLIENVATHVAQDNKGKITPAELMPYLPMSLKLVETALDGMVNEQSVFSDRTGDFKTYSFTAYENRAPKKGMSEFDACASCGKDLGEWKPNLICATCMRTVREELGKLAEKNAWPAHAVYEHEILYLAARHGKPVPAETLAADTRYTLSNMKKKLKRLVVEGYAVQELDEEAGLEKFRFPLSEYPRDRYQANMEIIAGYPASVMEELELKTVRIIITIALMLLVVFVLALMRVPLPILMGAFIVAVPVVSIGIWTHRSKPVDT